MYSHSVRNGPSVLKINPDLSQSCFQNIPNSYLLICNPGGSLRPYNSCASMAILPISLWADQRKLKFLPEKPRVTLHPLNSRKTRNKVKVSLATVQTPPPYLLAKILSSVLFSTPYYHLFWSAFFKKSKIHVTCVLKNRNAMQPK